MPTRICDIAKKYGFENKQILDKARSLGIAAAKVPSSPIDKISAQWLEGELLKDHPEIAAKFAAPSVMVKPKAPNDEVIRIFNPTPLKPATQTTDDSLNSNSTLRFEIRMSGSWSPAFMRQLQSGGISVEVVLVSEQDQTEKIRLNLIPNAVQEIDAGPKRIILDEKTKTILMRAYGAASANKMGE